MYRISSRPIYNQAIARPAYIPSSQKTGDGRGRVTVSDCHLGGRLQRQAYTGPVFALGVAPDGLPTGAGATKTQRTPSNGNVSSKRKSGVVVTLGDDSVVPAPPLASFQGGTAAQGAGGVSMGSSGVATGGGMSATARSPFVLKFWAGVDMVVCVSTVDIATQMGDPTQPPQQRWASDSAGLSRLTAFAITPDALQVNRGCLCMGLIPWVLSARGYHLIEPTYVHMEKDQRNVCVEQPWSMTYSE